MNWWGGVGEVGNRGEGDGFREEQNINKQEERKIR